MPTTRHTSPELGQAEKSKSPRARERGEANPARSRAARLSQTDRLLAALEKALADLALQLTLEFPGSNSVAWQVGVAARVPGELKAAIAREQARQQRIAENAADRAVRMAPKPKWEPWELETSAKMGFADPVDWRKYVGERQAAFNAGKPFPSPEEWRAAR